MHNDKAYMFQAIDQYYVHTSLLQPNMNNYYSDYSLSSEFDDFV